MSASGGPRVLLVSFGAVPSLDGHGVAVETLLRALAPRYQVDAMTVREGELPYVQNYLRSRLFRVPLEGTLSGRIETFRRAVSRQLEGGDYDIVHFRDPCGGAAVCATAAPESKLVYEIVGSTAAQVRQDDEALAAQLARTERECVERAAVVLVHSRVAQGQLASRVPRPRIALIPPGVNVDLFDWEPESTPEVPRIVYVGPVARHTGVLMLLAALPTVLRRHAVTLQLVGLGDEDFVERVKESARMLGVAEHLQLVGGVDHVDLPRLLSAATVCVAPTVRSAGGMGSCPLKLLEYAACRRPILAPRHSLVTEIFDEGEQMASFAAGDERDLARALVDLLEDGALRRRLADNAYRLVRERYPASAARRELLTVYRDLAEPGQSYARPLTDDELSIPEQTTRLWLARSGLRATAEPHK